MMDLDAVLCGAVVVVHFELDLDVRFFFGLNFEFGRSLF
jgi:hypothetical protein